MWDTFFELMAFLKNKCKKVLFHMLRDTFIELFFSLILKILLIFCIWVIRARNGLKFLVEVYFFYIKNIISNENIVEIRFFINKKNQ